MVVAQGLPLIQQGENILVDARVLHKHLKSKQEFANWIKARIRDYGFKENEDFLTNLSKSTGGRKAQDYHLTIDTAKELAMLERNEIGRAVRKFFIAEEKKLRGISSLPRETLAFKGIKTTKINNRLLLPYKEVLKACGYSTRCSSAGRRYRYPQHFMLVGNLLYITHEFASHLHHSRQVYCNRSALLAMQPVLPLNFGDAAQLNTKGGTYGN